MIDPLFNLLDWISHEHLTEIVTTSDSELGVAINQESVLVLLQEPEKQRIVNRLIINDAFFS